MSVGNISKASPHIVTAVPADQWPRWLEIGVELTQTDLVVGLEYIRQIPILAPVLPWEGVRDWLAFGMKLIAPNAFGKPDYLAHDGILADEPGDFRRYRGAAAFPVISVGSQLAWLEHPCNRHRLARGISGTASCTAIVAVEGQAAAVRRPCWLKRIPRPPWRISGAVRNS